MEIPVVDLITDYINGILLTHIHSVDTSLPQVSGRNRCIINLTNFSEQFTTNCGATIGPDEPITYNGFYIRDDYFPAKHIMVPQQCLYVIPS
ncbi:unnamed protein product [Adineta steineri]|uniref:Uncharacterized protein n=1 Tax=Adineta steineri TaxID=433720 RepID=A0A819U8L2_9BILA|nr:unnamed protein product [Adineta steineri]